jgi:hypothetical protein
MNLLEPAGSNKSQRYATVGYTLPVEVGDGVRPTRDAQWLVSIWPVEVSSPAWRSPSMKSSIRSSGAWCRRNAARGSLAKVGSRSDACAIRQSSRRATVLREISTTQDPATRPMNCGISPAWLRIGRARLPVGSRKLPAVSASGRVRSARTCRSDAGQRTQVARCAGAEMGDEIEAMIDRFPQHAATIRRLETQDPSFRAICDDYSEALRALGYWQTHGGLLPPEGRRQERPDARHGRNHGGGRINSAAPRRKSGVEV